MYFVAALAIVSRILLLAIVYTFRLWQTQPDLNLVNFLFEFSHRWDGNSYLFIAQNWYTNQGPEAGFIVFPPLYPIFVRAMTDLVPNFNFSALIVSNSFFILMCLTLYKLSRLDFDQQTSKKIATLFMLFPTSFFFNASYPESLYVFLLLAAFYFVRKQQYALSGVYAGMATLTRPFSLAIWPALFIEWLIGKNRKISNLVILIASGAISTAIYLAINYQTFWDYFAFNKMLSHYWQKSFSFFVLSIISSWKTGLFRIESDYYKYLVGYGEAISATIAWFVIIWSLVKYKINRVSYIVYSLIAIFMATSTSFILSVPRYWLSIPFLFIFVGKSIKNKALLYFIYTIFAIGNVYLLFRFSRGQWAF